MRQDGRTIRPLLLTVEQAATALNLGRTLTYRLLLRGELRSVRVGRRRLIPVSEIEKFVDQLGEADGDAFG